MRRSMSFGVGLAVALLAGTASAKPDKSKKAPVLRVAHSYVDAMAEAKDRNCVVFATFHADG